MLEDPDHGHHHPGGTEAALRPVTLVQPRLDGVEAGPGAAQPLHSGHVRPVEAGLPQAAQDSLGKSVPFPQRMGSPDEYAALVHHIFANGYLNGEVIRLDGALRMAP